METQTQAILKYLQTHEGLSQREATIKLDCIRLGARIHDLRKMGYDIITEMRTGKNKSHYAFYVLMKEGNNELES